MKMNIRNIALIAAMVSTVAVANAQSFELRGAGLAGNTFTVAPGGAFDVEVWYNPGSTAAHNAMYIALGFGQAGSNSGAADLDSKITMTGWTSAGPITTAVDGNMGRALANPSAGSNNPFGAGTGSSAARPWGSYMFGLIPPPSTVSITGPVMVGTAHLQTSLGNGESYTGLVVYNQGGTQTSPPSLRASGVGYASGGARGGSAVYSVTAVPEPGTMVAVAAGLAALASRRRNKK